jgi:hypothetical protein
MPVLKITEKTSSPEVRQFSVFLKNKVGALLEIVKLLQEHKILVLAISVVDSSESSIGRMITSDPESTAKIFSEHGIPYSECKVLLVELQEGAADLSHALAALLMAEVNILFSYPMLTRPRGRAVLAIHVDDSECASSVLVSEGFKLLEQSDLSR